MDARPGVPPGDQRLLRPRLRYEVPGHGRCGRGVSHSAPSLRRRIPPRWRIRSPGFEIGVGLFNPNRQYEVVGNPSGYPGTFGLMPGTVESGSAACSRCRTSASRWKLGDKAAVRHRRLRQRRHEHELRRADVRRSSRRASTWRRCSSRRRWPFKLHPDHAVGVTAVLGYQMLQGRGPGRVRRCSRVTRPT